MNEVNMTYETLDYEVFIQHPERKTSREVDFGVHWRLLDEKDGSPWRVSWIANTGELYAVEVVAHGKRRAIVFGRYAEREQVEKILEGWAERPLRIGPLGNRAYTSATH